MKVAQITLPEKSEATKQILDSVLREVCVDVRQSILLQALAANLDELIAAAEEMRQQHQKLIASEQRVAHERHRYQELFELTPNGYVVTDLEGNIQEINQNAAQLFNASQNVLINMPLTEVIKDTHLQGFLDLLDKARHHKKKLEIETIIQPLKKASFGAYLRVTGSYNLFGELIGLRWIINDLTMIKNREAERIYRSTKAHKEQLELENSKLILSELNKVAQIKDNLLSSISHELRSPLCSIKLGLTTIKECFPISAESECLLDVLNQECSREIRLIENILRLKIKEERPVEKQMHLLGIIQLAEWLPHIIQPYYEKARNKNIELITTIEEGLHQFVGDTIVLKNLLIELFNNACKYTPENGLITVHVQKGANSSLTRPTQSIIITNNAPKIPTNQLWRIFEAFYRIPTNDPYVHNGLGIGLSLALKYTQDLGATLRVHSSAQATTFTIEIPEHNVSVSPIENTKEDFEFVSGVILSS